MKLSVKAGTTDYSVLVFIQDSSATDGSGLTGLDDTKVDAYYCRLETDNDVAKGDVGINDLSVITDDHTDGGFIEIDSSNLPGWYRLDLPDAVIAAGAWVAGVRIYDSGDNDVADCCLEIQLAPVVADATQIEGADASDQINAAVDTAIETYHLDHLFATDYDPASKPGIATALLNELVESDGGVSRLTANALERAPDTTTGLTLHSDYDAAKTAAAAGAAMALTSGERTTLAAAIEAAIINELDGTAVMQAIADLIAGDMTTGDLSVVAIATACRDAILDRVLAGNHDTNNTTGKLLQYLDAAITSRHASGAAVAKSPATLASTDVTGNLPADVQAWDGGDVPSPYEGTPPTADAIADAVWDEAYADHDNTGSYGILIGAAFEEV